MALLESVKPYNTNDTGVGADNKHHGSADDAADSRPLHQELFALPGPKHEQVADVCLWP